MFEAEFWVAVAFVLFLGVLGYFGVHKLMVEGSTTAATASRPTRRGAPPQGEAQALLANTSASSTKPSARRSDHRRRQGGGRALAAEAKTKIEEFVARRTKMAETKIAQAEAQASPTCAPPPPKPPSPRPKKLLPDTVKGKVADDLIVKGIADVKSKLN